MFTLLPNTSAPLAGLLTAHTLQVASVVLAFATIAICLVFGKRGRGDGGGADSIIDCGDGDGASCD